MQCYVAECPDKAVVVIAAENVRFVFCATHSQYLDPEVFNARKALTSFASSSKEDGSV